MATQRVIAVRGERVDGPAVARLLAGLERDEDGLRGPLEVDAEGATFVGPTDFSKVRFRSAKFRGATFEGAATFEDSRFEGEADFASADFDGMALFAGTTFADKATFEYIEGSGGARAGSSVEFRRPADFRRAVFERGARFGGARFHSRARFGAARFGISFDRRVAVSFRGAVFMGARTFGPMLVWGGLSLERASFDAPVQVTVSAYKVRCVAAQFRARTSIRIRFAEVDLRDAEFALPSLLAGSDLEFLDEDNRHLEDGELERLPRLHPDEPWKPRITSIDGANVGALTVSDVDLSECGFVGAHNLDGLRFESADFPTVENIWGSRRRAIFEELELRPERPDEAERIARAYRALRKGREDNKDEPGAADFYYGEMEMRRMAHRRRGESAAAKRTSRPEWLVLWAYRLISGYGLRSSRALLWLLGTVLLFAWGFQAEGFEPDQNFWKSLIFSLESAPSLVRPPTLGKEAGVQIVLTDWGHLLQMGLRLLGALFFGLALLALRGRVKR